MLHHQEIKRDMHTPNVLVDDAVAQHPSSNRSKIVDAQEYAELYSCEMHFCDSGFLCLLSLLRHYNMASTVRHRVIDAQRVGLEPNYNLSDITQYHIYALQERAHKF
jgi:hypothetical protein